MKTDVWLTDTVDLSLDKRGGGRDKAKSLCELLFLNEMEIVFNGKSSLILLQDHLMYFSELGLKNSLNYHSSYYDRNRRMRQNRANSCSCHGKRIWFKFYFICVIIYKNETINCIYKYITQIGFRRKSNDFYKSRPGCSKHR